MDGILERSKHVRGLLLRKLHGSPFAVAGDPDLFGSYRGQAIAVEVKRPGENPTPLQQQRLHEWATAGALAFTCRSVKGFFDGLGI